MRTLYTLVLSALLLLNTSSAAFAGTSESLSFSHEQTICDLLGYSTELECDAYWYWVENHRGVTHNSHGEDTHDDVVGEIQRKSEGGWAVSETVLNGYTHTIITFEAGGSLREVRNNESGETESYYEDGEGNQYQLVEDADGYQHWEKLEGQVDGGDDDDDDEDDDEDDGSEDYLRDDPTRPLDA